MKASELLQELVETVHYGDPDWDGPDAIPDQDGRPGWDTPASAADPDDEEEPDPDHNPDDPDPPERHARYAAGQHWVTIGGAAKDGKKHAGGHPVLLDGAGRIVAGAVPRNWHGQHVSAAHRAGVIEPKKEASGGRATTGRTEPGTGGAATPATGGRVAPEAGRPGHAKTDPGGEGTGESPGPRTTEGVSAFNPDGLKQAAASALRVFAKLDRMQQFFAGRGDHERADWMRQVRAHVEAVGPEAALAELGPEGARGPRGQVQYFGGDTHKGGEPLSDFCRAYLDRHGITPTSTLGGAPLDPSKPYVSTVAPSYGGGGREGQGKDFAARDPTLKDKLAESKALPGLESSEDINTLAGRRVTHLTPDVLAKFDETYGKGQWIVKTYGKEAFAGQGIYFPQKADRVVQEARAAVHEAEVAVGRYGFSLLRDEAGTVVGVRHDASGTGFCYGSPEYQDQLYGDVRAAADGIAGHHEEGEYVPGAVDHERGVMLPFGGADFMAQPAFPAVGISDAERAEGVTFKTGSEGRVHVVTRNGKAELVPHAAWLKGDPPPSLPVVFENEDTRTMAQAAVDAINALPESERQGQIYAPDVMRTRDGFRVVEANPSNYTGFSGYAGDNPFIIDAITSHLTGGQEPAHVRFIRGLLTSRGRTGAGEKEAAVPFAREREAVPYSGVWSESAHPRGQPGNAGEFAPKGGATAGTHDTLPKRNPVAPALTAPTPVPPAEPPKKEKRKYGPSKAKVIFRDVDTPENVAEVIREQLGLKATPEAVASLVGAPDDAVVEITAVRGGKMIVVNVDHPVFTARRYIGNDKNGSLFIKNDEFFMKPGAQGKGLGSDVFGRQVEQAQEMGVDYIACHAAKDNPRNPDKPHNGYYTWPRLGYDQSLEDLADEEPGLASTVRKKFPGAKTILDVMKTREGRDWWKANGTDLFDMRFDLAPGSRSLRVLEAYLEERAA